MVEKGSVILKHKPEDFIVEEVWDNYICIVSDNVDLLKDSKVNLGKFDIDDRRAFLTFELEKLNLDHFNVLSVLS